MKSEEKRTGLLYQDVLEKIEQMISTGVYKPGDRLPSERDLAETFGVSRVPVREAIKILEYAEVLKIVPGDGVYLRSSPKTIPNISNISSWDITADLLMDLFEMRCVLESSACYFAAQRRTDEDILRLQNIIDETRKKRLELSTYDEGGNEGIYEDLKRISHKFHTTMIEAAHNTVLNSIYKNLYEALEISKTLTISQADYTFNGILAHEYLLQKVIEQKADEARNAMLQHLEDARQKVLRTLKKEMEHSAQNP